MTATGVDAQAAADRLTARADWLEQRAGRARTGHNDRRKCDARAMHLRSCAKLIEAPTVAGAQIRAGLEEAGALGLGWRQLSEWVTLLAGKFAKAAT